MLNELFLQVAHRVDGAVLVRDALVGDPTILGHALGSAPETACVHVLSIGKVAFPMFEGLVSVLGRARISGGLVVAPETRFPEDPLVPAGVACLVSDHPEPSMRSVAAARAARDLLRSLSENNRLVVLLSGGGSAALCLPAGDLSLDEKRKTVREVSRAGANITELNTVRKHLSAIKGGQLGIATQAPTVVFALSDVVGNDPGTIASGPFSPDPTTFGQAVALVEKLAPSTPARALEHLRRGAAGAIPETPKAGDPRLAHIDYRLLAGPERVADEARRVALSKRLATGVLVHNTESRVTELARAYGERARQEVRGPGPARVFIGNGEPTIVVAGHGKGGRATHLALLMAREISGLHEVSFLAAGTDDRDGSSVASGAVVDGATWTRAERAGLDPAAALERCDSETPLSALGCLVRGPGTSNLLDLHLLAVGA
jgi:glycerate 2-kinase